MSRCGCKPGTPENGWHEERAEECIRAELESFARVLIRLPEVIEELKAKR